MQNVKLHNQFKKYMFNGSYKIIDSLISYTGQAFLTVNFVFNRFVCVINKLKTYVNVIEIQTVCIPVNTSSNNNKSICAAASPFTK